MAIEIVTPARFSVTCPDCGCTFTFSGEDMSIQKVCTERGGWYENSSFDTFLGVVCPTKGCGAVFQHVRGKFKIRRDCA